MGLHLAVVVVVTFLYSANCQSPDWDQRNPDYDDAWKKYKADYSKVYANSNDECNRRVIWEGNVKLIEQFNLPSSGSRTYEIGLNQFSDWSPAEISAKLTGYLPPPVEMIANKLASSPAIVGTSDLDCLNYTCLGYVSPVKMQDCNNGYAYAAAGAMEGQLFKEFGELVEMSTQNIVDCCSNGKYGINGCDNGNIEGAFQCSKDTDGFPTNDIYPPKGVEQNCSIPEESHARYWCQDFQIVKPNDEAALKKAVEAVGPIACYMHGSNDTFRLYNSGVYSDLSCGIKLDHAVLITGFGKTPDGVKYWIVKNSWGKGWGENGYFRIMRDVNLCGIGVICTYPTNCGAIWRIQQKT